MTHSVSHSGHCMSYDVMHLIQIILHLLLKIKVFIIVVVAFIKKSPVQYQGWQIIYIVFDVHVSFLLVVTPVNSFKNLCDI